MSTMGRRLNLAYIKISSSSIVSARKIPRIIQIPRLCVRGGWGHFSCNLLSVAPPLFGRRSTQSGFLPLQSPSREVSAPKTFETMTSNGKDEEIPVAIQCTFFFFFFFLFTIYYCSQIFKGAFNMLAMKQNKKTQLCDLQCNKQQWDVALL